MEQDEITRRNVAIADYWKSEIEDQESPTIYFWFGDHYEAHELLFHEDWDWIMPTVEDIAKSRKEAFHHGPSYKGGWFARFGMDKNAIGDTMIEATWLAVSEYVLALKS